MVMLRSTHPAPTPVPTGRGRHFGRKHDNVAVHYGPWMESTHDLAPGITGSGGIMLSVTCKIACPQLVFTCSAVSPG